MHKFIILRLDKSASAVAKYPNLKESGVFSLYVGVSAYDPCPQIRHFKDKLSLWMCDDADTLFFKPSRGSQSDSHFVSSSLSNLDSIMSAYKALSLVPLSFEYMLYPVGIMTLNDAAIRPSTNIVQFVNQCLASDFPDDAFPVGSPLLMFDRLDSSWTNEKPSDHLGASYTANMYRCTWIGLKQYGDESQLLS